MDKKDDNKKPSKDKKKDKKDKKDKKKKVIKKKSDDKISQSQIVNIKIGDISKPRRTRRKAAPKAAPPPPQIQRQLQYLPSLAGQAPMIPPPLTPAPTPPPAPPRPPPPPAPAAEPRRTGDFFSDTSGVDSRYGTTYDLGSTPEVEYLGGVSRSSYRPTLSQSLRSRSGSEMSSLTDVDFGEAASINSALSRGSFQQFGENINLNDLDSGKFGDDATPPTRILRRGVDEMSVVDDLTDFDMKEQRRKLRLNNVTQSTQAESESEEGIIGRVQATGDDDSIESFLMFDPRFQVTRTTQSTQPEEALGAGADFEDIAAPSVVNISDNLGFVSSQQPQEIQQLQPTQAPTEAQPILGMLPDPQPQDLVLSSQKPKELKIPKPASDAAEEKPVKDTQLEAPPIEAEVIEPTIAEPISADDPRLSQLLQAQAQEQAQAVVKGDVRPEDEATGGGGRKQALILSKLTTEQKNTLFTMYENELFEQKVEGQADAIIRYNLKTRQGNNISTKQFSQEYVKWQESKNPKQTKKGKK